MRFIQSKKIAMKGVYILKGKVFCIELRVILKHYIYKADLKTEYKYCKKNEQEFVMYMCNKCTEGMMILSSPKRGKIILVSISK